jgi:Domain of unknown function DUF29
LAEEIEGMGNSERRDLAARMARLTAHLLAWRCPPESRSGGLRATIDDERKRISLALKEAPSLKAILRDRIGGTACGWTRAFTLGRNRASRTVVCRTPAPGQWSRRPIWTSGQPRQSRSLLLAGSLRDLPGK